MNKRITIYTRSISNGRPHVPRGSKQVLFSYRKTTFPVPAGTVYTDQTTGQRGRVGPKGLSGVPWHAYVIGG